MIKEYKTVNRDTSNLTRYVESACIDHRLLRKAEESELRESLTKCPSKLRESFGDESTKGWWVPISFYNKKNGNGRIYNKQLWENVIDNQRDTWVGAPMLADHPEGDSDGSPKDICGIWLDAKMDEPDQKGIGLVYGLLIPSGRLGADLKDHLSNGLKVGTSSSGFGKLLGDNCTIDPNSFIIERLSDWVLNPSQGTFFSYDEDDDGVVDHSRYGEKTTNKVMEESIKENTVNKDSKFTKLEEKKFRRDMESFLESAESIGDPQERLKEYEDIKSYLEDGACPDLKEKVEQKIAEQEEFIKTALKEKIEFKESLEIESPNDLRKKLTKIAEDAQILDQDAKEWKNVAEKLQEKYNSTKEELGKRHTEAFVNYQKNKISSLEKKLESHDEKSKTLLKEMRDTYFNMNEKYNELCKKYESLDKKYRNTEKNLNESFSKLEEMTNLKEALEKANRELTDALKESKNNNKKLIKVVESQRNAIEKSVSVMDTLKERNENSKKAAKTFARNLKTAEKFIEKKTKEQMLDEAARVTDTSVHQYYETLYSRYGNDIVPFKDDILSSATLTEAKNRFFKEILNNLPESQRIEKDRLPESVSVDAKDRIKKMGAEKLFKKQSAIDRKPEGWY